MRGFIAIADKRQGESAIRVILLSQQFHTQHFGVKPDGTVEVTNPQHGVQNPHLYSSSVTKACVEAYVG
jgi:hypothetical protein